MSSHSSNIGSLAERGIATAVFATFLSLTPGLVGALELRVYSATRHDRFTGFPSAPVHSTSFIHKDVDLTGVGWRVGGSQPRSLTLVSPKFFVGARHFRPAVGSNLRFVAADGTVRNYTVHANHEILNDDPPEEGGPKPTDLSLGELVETVAPSDGVSFQTYLNLPTEAAYLASPNNELIVLGKTTRGGNGITNAISDFFGTPLTAGGGVNNTRTLEFAYQDLGGLQDDGFAESGDSGSPSLVNVNNRGAIVGVHTSILTVLGTTTTIDSFLPHPPYISQINDIMSAQGYHMTEANPASVALTMTVTHPPIVRAGYMTSLDLEIANTDPSNDANNLKVSAAFPGGGTSFSFSGPQWISDGAGGADSARKGGLAGAQSTNLSTFFTPPNPGSFNLPVEYSADESPAIIEMVPLAVIESYLSWSSQLSDPDPSADLDLDGYSNLLEYAFGGDPEDASVFQPDGVTRLAPHLARSASGNDHQIQYLRRKDAQQRALTYVLERSPNIQNMSWLDTSSENLETVTESVNDEFERVIVTLNLAAEAMFYRVSISLSEST